MLFDGDLWPRLADGSVTLTFRTWSRPQAKAGGRYRVGGLLLEATAVDRVPRSSITEDDARRAGATDRATLLRRLGDADEVWRIELRCLGRDDRTVLGEHPDVSHDELAAIRTRLARLDRDQPWTRTTLRLIDRYPGIVSTKLAEHVGME